MNRRNVLAAASTAAVPLLLAMGRPVLAQDRMASSGGTLGAAKHKMLTLQVGSLSLQTSELALQRAKNPKLREFAGFERDEQMTIAQVLTDTQSPAPAQLDPADAAILKKLSAASGAEFDTMYVTDQIEGHTKLLQIQQDFLQGLSATTSDAAHVSMLARTVIQMHLKMLADLQTELRT
jgi:putative membrane protein